MFVFVGFYVHTGKRLVECILEAKKWPKSIPKISDSGIAIAVANLLVQSKFFHRSEKVEGKKGVLKVLSKKKWLYCVIPASAD